MGISFSCSGCAQQLQAPEKMAGKRVKCPKCGCVVTVPQPAGSVPAANRQVHKAEGHASDAELAGAVRANLSSSELERMLRALEQPIQPVRRSFFYRFWLAVLAVIMVALPLIYLALIAALGYGIYSHAVSNAHILGEGPTVRNRIFVTVLYFIPIVAGIVAILFLVKPFFAPRKETWVPLELTPKDQPFLFKHLEAVCRALGAPMPREVNVDVQINASAHLRRGIWGVFGKDLVLTIGLPLAANFSIRELTGVIAHEMGHFTQGAGMGVTYIVRSINAWFAQIVYERDAWDERLQAWSHEGAHYSIFLTAAAIRLCVWLSRIVLWVLMHIGHAVSCSMLRQMEFGADLYEIRLAGSRAFESANRRFPPLQVAGDAAAEHLSQMINQGKLPDDLPWMVLYELKRLPASDLRKIEEVIENTGTSLFDTHPSMRDRRERAREEAAPGLPLNDQPATGLFRDFRNLCRLATRHHYLSMFGSDVMNQIQVLPSGELVKANEGDWAAEESLDRFLQIPLPSRTPILLNVQALRQPSDGPGAQLRLKEARERHALAVAKNVESSVVHEAVFDDWRKTRCALAILNAGGFLDTKALGLPNNPGRVAGILEEKRKKLLATEASLRNMAQAAARRLEAAILWLNSDAAKQMDQAKSLYKRAAQLVVAAQHLGTLMPAVVELTQIAVETKTLEMVREENPDAGAAAKAHLNEEIQTRTNQMLAKMNDIQAAFKRIPDPFAPTPSQQPAESSEYQTETVGAAANAEVSADAAESLFDTVFQAYGRVVKHLAHIAEKAEQAAGFGPLELSEKAVEPSAAFAAAELPDEAFSVEAPEDTTFQTPQIGASTRPHPARKRALGLSLGIVVLLALIVAGGFTVSFISKLVNKRKPQSYALPASTGLIVHASPTYTGFQKGPFNPGFEVRVSNATGHTLTQIKIIGTVTFDSYSDTKVFDALAEAKCESLAELEGIGFHASFKTFTPPANQPGGASLSRLQYHFEVDDDGTR